MGIVQRMRLTNPQIQALALAVKLPIIAGEWGIHEADWRNVDGLDQAAAEQHAITVRHGFFENPIDDWSDTLAHALLKLDYGFMLFEKIWEVCPDGTYAIHKFGPRLPQTITGWMLQAVTI